MAADGIEGCGRLVGLVYHFAKEVDGIEAFGAGGYAVDGIASHFTLDGVDVESCVLEARTEFLKLVLLCGREFHLGGKEQPLRHAFTRTNLLQILVVEHATVGQVLVDEVNAALAGGQNVLAHVLAAYIGQLLLHTFVERQGRRYRFFAGKR